MVMQNGFPVDPLLVQIVDGTPPTGVVQTPTVSSHTASGTVAAGANSVSIGNVGAAAGTVNGVSIPAGVSLSWSAVPGDTLDAIVYDATGTVFLVTEVR